ncbi:hypothetical protein BJX66DRAFT_297715 [Aspergillus keveii]|uniref:Secreted protein n=1 Tax=Aspergillus keveii TaxID=714993 RepID=A0ABR4GEC6_9EURO
MLCCTLYFVAIMVLFPPALTALFNSSGLPRPGNNEALRTRQAAVQLGIDGTAKASCIREGPPGEPLTTASKTSGCRFPRPRLHGFAHWQAPASWTRQILLSVAARVVDSFAGALFL